MDSYLVQIGLPVIALVVSMIAFFWEFVVIRRKHLGYRVQMDTPVTGEIESVYPGVLEQLQPDGGAADTHLQDLSVVLIRVENDGVTNIDSADYAMPDDGRVGLRLHFPGRRVAGMAVTELSDTVLGAYLEPGRGIAAHADEAHDVGIIDLPKVPMNRRDHYKILAILSRGTGTGPHAEPTLHGKLKGGRVRTTQSRTGLSRNMLAFIGFLVNRAFGSGTRETFQQRLLGGNAVTLPEAGCRTIQVTNPPGVASCEVPLTGDMLKAVADIPGAVGYSSYTEAAGYPGIAAVTIGGRQPTRDEVLAHNYAFWGVEYAYSKGELPYDSLSAAFLRFLTDRAGKDIIRSRGGTPCGELADPARCSPER
ncbi:hypothetical protein [Nocardia miyunensis]|uniref:hypothetical protein n=1 Tax=Nocardia miyunensis TaxID=282684 RepID=UPI0008365775|nr:hypothetical protein [Nocardia miyunensis]